MAEVTAPISSPMRANRPPVATVLSVEPLRDTDQSAWDGYVAGHGRGTLFHTTAWRNAVSDAFAHASHYLVAKKGDDIVGVLPSFVIKSKLVGRVMVSVPYGVGGGILADDPSVTRALFDAAKKIAADEKCRAIDLRSEVSELSDVPVVDGYAGFSRELPTSSSDVLKWLPRKARAAARNARHKFKLTVAYGDEHLTTVWRLYTRSMRRLASPNYPFSFFSALIRHTPARHWVSLVRFRGRPVAGLVTFLFGDTVMPYFVGMTDDARACSAANFVYMTNMERAVGAGYRIYDFGRTRIANVGSFDFKRFHGFEPRPLGYQCHVMPGAVRPDLDPDSGRYRWMRGVWRRLPLAVTRNLGAYVSRHLTG